MSDPPERPTKEIPAADPVAVMIKQMQDALTASMQAGFRETNANIDLVSGDVKSLKRDVRDLQEWKIAVEKSPPPLTSDRVRAAVVEHSSQVDMEAQAREADRLIKDRDRDQQIAETRALVEQAATKEDVKLLAEGTATKAEVQSMLSPTAEKVEHLTATQDLQLAILSRLDKVASNPTVKVIAGMIATAILTWLFSHGGALK